MCKTTISTTEPITEATDLSILNNHFLQQTHSITGHYGILLIKRIQALETELQALKNKNKENENA